MKKVFILNSNSEYNNLFKSLGFSLTTSLKEASLVCFTGGADVSPQLYGAHEHALTHTHPARDVQEKLVFDNARELGIPMVGICRGAQFLNVMSGGAMYQHVTKHTRPHDIVDKFTGECVLVSSTHHQMMKPSEDGTLVAFSSLGGEREWYEGQVFHRDISAEDNEVVFYAKSKCLCFQPHPEFDEPEYASMREYFRSLLTRYLSL